MLGAKVFRAGDLMRILVTRPEPDGLKLKGLLEERGHEAEVEPLMRASTEGFEPVDLDGITALIATSRNALRAIRGQVAGRAVRELKIYTVGAGTAEEARRLGFGTIVRGPGTIAELLPIIASTLDPTEELLLNLRGERVSMDVPLELEALGYRVSDAVVYRMISAEAFSENVQEQLGNGEIEGVMLMSPQTAAIYARLVVKHRLQTSVREVVHLCLSDAVAGRLNGIKEIPIDVADHPTVEEMLDLVDLAAAKLDD